MTECSPEINSKMPLYQLVTADLLLEKSLKDISESQKAGEKPNMIELTKQVAAAWNIANYIRKKLNASEFSYCVSAEEVDKKLKNCLVDLVDSIKTGMNLDLDDLSDRLTWSRVLLVEIRMDFDNSEIKLSKASEENLYNFKN